MKIRGNSMGNHSAFTLIELLVVIAIIAILAAILFPVFAQAKQAAKKANSLSNQKQIALATQMYAGDYDDTLPETGWDGPCQRPAEIHTLTSASVGDAFWSGVYAFPLANQPYMKNLQLVQDPADPDKGVWGKEGSYCYEAQLVAFGIQGAYTGMAPVAGAMAKAFPVSYAGNYFLARAYDAPRGSTTDKGRILTEIVNPANVVFTADVGSARLASGGVFAGWYIAPGYGNNGNGTGRWERGGRYGNGRNWTFTDGHAKFVKDTDYKNPDGTTKAQRNIMWEYQQRGIYSFPETPDNNYCPKGDTTCTTLSNRKW
ncbi:MAG: prepilin-type N-terminal cleavage/methylation domain-containing protein [Armatimonadetes bacterium]|nr:prepilin-type N-terminal cleavage/methylation domain-containing protein [Armatimonadota bacterium]MBX3108757.1 prepilin-type N-terminal cleavage/methylation domain-containing protein [Fimbriimonadaceae bacterium]